MGQRRSVLEGALSRRGRRQGDPASLYSDRGYRHTHAIGRAKAAHVAALCEWPPPPLREGDDLATAAARAEPYEGKSTYSSTAGGQTSCRAPESRKRRRAGRTFASAFFRYSIRIGRLRSLFEAWWKTHLVEGGVASVLSRDRGRHGIADSRRSVGAGRVREKGWKGVSGNEERERERGVKSKARSEDSRSENCFGLEGSC